MISTATSSTVPIQRQASIFNHSGVSRPQFQGLCLVSDSGGTNSRFNLLDDERDELVGTTLKLATPPTGEGFISVIQRALSMLLAQLENPATVDYLAMAVAGPVNINTGKVIGTNTGAYTIADETPFAQAVTNRTQVPAVLVNDADAFVLGEVLSPKGALYGKKDAIGITLGTGIGGGAVVNGKLLTIQGRSVMEVGHMVIQKDGRKVAPPRTHGCWEAYASGSGLLETGREKLLASEAESGALTSSVETLKNPEIFQAAERGESWAVETVAQWHEDIACGLANVINMLGITDVVIGGGLSSRVDYARLAKLVQPRLIFPEEVKREVNIVPSRLGDDAALIGAAHLAKALRQSQS